MNSGVEQLRMQYDEAPYASHPFPQSAPENLAAVAHLFGLRAPPVATARVLELGCSSGGNLVPIATRHPHARLLGLDLSGVQVRQGNERIAAMGLANLELREADLAQVGHDELGEFDYIICHGVYSWVPAELQEAILRICREHLSPEGVAYVSYNTYPGWKAKEIVRDAMMLRGNPRDTPAERLSFARGMVDFLQQVARKGSVLATTLEESAPLLRTSQDYYLLHEYLEAFNAPCYFQQLLDRADAVGLSYLAEAEPSGMFVGNYGSEIAGPLLKECGHSQVLLEQYLDFVVNRTFRQTLLVHKPRAAAIRYRLDQDRHAAFHFAANLPCHEAMRDDGSSQGFGAEGKAQVITTHTEVKRAVEALTAAWPATLAHAEILAQAVEGNDTAAARTRVDDLLEFLVTRGFAKYRLDAVDIKAPQDPARPCIDQDVRRMAAASRGDADAGTFNGWHDAVLLNPVERWLLPELDGTRDRQALIDSLVEHVAQKHVLLLREGQPLADPGDIASTAALHVDALLARLPEMKLQRGR